MLRLLKFLPVSFLLFIGACSKDSATPAPVPTSINFTATLSGASEVPANPSTATGTATGVFNTTTKVLTVTTTYAGITVTAAHIHKAAAGSNGPVEFPFTVSASPIVFTSAALSTSDESDLKENKMYVNLHSAAYAGGEIRGQLIKQ